MTYIIYILTLSRPSNQATTSYNIGVGTSYTFICISWVGMSTTFNFPLFKMSGQFLWKLVLYNIL